MFRILWNQYKASFKKEYLVHILVFVGLIGIFCAVLSSCQEDQPQAAELPEITSQEAYRTALQNELSEILCQIDGVGRAEVLVTLSGSETCHYAQDAQNRYLTAGSRREALVESVSLPAVTGVVVACDGGGTASVQEIVYQTVSVACGLGYSQIYVTKLDNIY